MMNNNLQSRSRVLCAQILLGVVVLLGATGQALALNPIQIENALNPAGGEQWNWASEPLSAHNIEGYADQASVNQGGIIRFYVNARRTRNATYNLTIYRLGYYNGAGARRMTAPVPRTSVTQTIPTPNATFGLAECNWTSPYSFTIPTTWTSGIYVATIVGTTTNEGAYIPFVVKQASSTAAYVFQTSDTTWQAYNSWGGKSLYGFNSTNGVQAKKVSYNRPYEGNGLGSLGNWELQTLRFLEKNGYDVTYQSNIDTHLGGVTQLLQHKAYLSVGHDEYWSKAMRDNVETAKSRGLSLGFFGANAAYWQIRFENSGTGAANRTIVAYKESAASDPIGTPALVTSQWRDPLYANRPENALIGVMYTYDPVNANIVVTNATHWAYTGTGLVNGSTLPGLLGYEVDSFFSNGKAPAGLEILAHSPANTALGIYSDMSIYTQACSVAPCANASATVFATGSMQWAWGLDSFYAPVNVENVAAKQITHNVLARMASPGASLPALPPNSGGGSVNTTPTFVGGTTSLAIAQNSPAVDLKPNLHVSDTDAGQTETWSQSAAPLHGTLVFTGATASSGSTDITPGGTITYQPTAGYSGTDSFTVRVTDGTATATRTFAITVSAATNIAPTFVGGTTSLTIAQNSAAVDLKPNLHVSDTNVGQTETWSQSTAPLHGTLVFTGATASSGSTDITPGGVITYQPTAGYSGTDSFTVRVTDGTATATRTFAVTVTAASTNLLTNPSLELAGTNGQPTCWQFGGWGTNTPVWTRISTGARSGTFAEQLQITSFTSGDAKLVVSLDAGQGAGGCAPTVLAGASYQISAYYKATVSPRFVLYYLDASNVWQYWQSGNSLAIASAWTQATMTTGVVPAGAKAISFGLALEGVGTLTTDDYSLIKL